MLDASVTLAWCFEDEGDPYAERVLDSLEESAQAMVPGIWRYEVANGLIVAVRQRRAREESCLGFLAELKRLPIAEPDFPLEAEAIFQVGRRYGLEAYDSAYLHLAARSGVPLATSDAGLRRAARKARVPLYPA